MSTHRQTGEIDGPFTTDDPVYRLLEFFLANGYRVVERQRESPDAEESAPLASVRLERGRAGAGWWTSDMTELHTRVDLVGDDESDLVRVRYEVDTSGQLLSDVEEAFWSRELQWAKRYLRDDSDEPRDLREDEAQRAKNQKDDLFSVGLWGAVGIFMVIIVLGFFGII